MSSLTERCFCNRYLTPTVAWPLNDVCIAKMSLRFYEKRLKNRNISMTISTNYFKGSPLESRETKKLETKRES